MDLKKLKNGSENQINPMHIYLEKKKKNYRRRILYNKLN